MVRIGLSLVVCCLCLCLLPGSASAQELRRYVFAAPGSQGDVTQSAKTYELGFGLERLLTNVVGAKGEVAGLMFTDDDGARKGVGLASADLVIHYRPHQVDLFGEGGYTLLVRDFTSNLFNIGGGVGYWFREDRALTLEMRYHKGPSGDPLPNYWDVRIGIAFR